MKELLIYKMNVMKKIAALLILSLSAFMFTSSSSQNDPVVGLWLTKEGKGKVKIFKATNGKYYGKIVWLKDPNEANGFPKKDKNNPVESLRNEPLVNLVVLKGFDKINDKQLENGTIYDPENGKTYSCLLELESPTHLKVRGYIGFSMIGRTEYWTKAE